MAREMNMLSDAKIRSLQKKKARGFYCDGGGLYLQVSPTGSTSWVFRFKDDGKTRDMGLGSTNTFSLKEARERARQQRQLRADNIDPIEARNAEREAQRIAKMTDKTFDQCAADFLSDNSIHWKNAKHRQQWRNTLDTYVSPVFGSVSVRAIDTALVLQVLRPIWNEKPETASRVRGRIERILSHATASGARSGDNPARWTGHLKEVLPARSKVAKVEHHAALPWKVIGDFMGDLRGRPALAARALDFTILTAARTAETIGAKWPEIDFDEKIWTVPADRMKGKREHRVPLSPPAIAILQELKPKARGFIFENDGQPLSNMAMLKLLERMGHEGLTVHGFRSSFRDWAFECSNFPREIVESALAHVVGDKAEAAYKRGEAIEKRRKLMQAWASFCGQPSAKAGNVVTLARA